MSGGLPLLENRFVAQNALGGRDPSTAPGFTFVKPGSAQDDRRDYTATTFSEAGWARICFTRS